jgi:hypothetical protein
MSDKLLALLGLGGAVAGGGALTKSAYDRLQNIGEQSLVGLTVGDTEVPGAIDLAQQSLEMSRFRPFTVTSATGGTFDVTPELDPETGAVTGIDATYGITPEEQALQTALLSDAQSLFSGVADPRATREQEIFNQIRATQAAEEERERLLLEERLASQGRLGVRTSMFGGTPEQLALAQEQQEARDRATIMAMEQARAEQAQQAALGSDLLASAYVPQAQMINLQQATQLYPQLQQQMSQFGTGQYGETMMTGLEARLLAEQTRADLLGGIGSGMLGGLFTPVQTDGGVSSLAGSLLGKIFS